METNYLGGAVGFYAGMRVVTNPFLTEEKYRQIKWPRCHKNRWRTVKKFFLKYYKPFDVPSTDFVIMNGPYGKVVMCHPMMYERLRRDHPKALGIL